MSTWYILRPGQMFMVFTGDDPPAVKAFKTPRRHRSKANGNGSKPRPMDGETARKVLKSAANPRDRALFHFLLDTGARPGEAIRVKIGGIKRVDGETQALLDDPSRKPPCGPQED